MLGGELIVYLMNEIPLSRLTVGIVISNKQSCVVFHNLHAETDGNTLGYSTCIVFHLGSAVSVLVPRARKLTVQNRSSAIIGGTKGSQSRLLEILHIGRTVKESAPTGLGNVIGKISLQRVVGPVLTHGEKYAVIRGKSATAAENTECAVLEGSRTGRAVLYKLHTVRGVDPLVCVGSGIVIGKSAVIICEIFGEADKSIAVALDVIHPERAKLTRTGHKSNRTGLRIRRDVGNGKKLDIIGGHIAVGIKHSVVESGGSVVDLDLHAEGFVLCRDNKLGVLAHLVLVVRRIVVRPRASLVAVKRCVTRKSDSRLLELCSALHVVEQSAPTVGLFVGV